MENDAGCPNAAMKFALDIAGEVIERDGSCKLGIFGKLGRLGIIDDNVGSVSFGNAGGLMGFNVGALGRAGICGIDKVLMVVFWDAQADENFCNWDFIPAPRLLYVEAIILARALNSWV